MVLRHGVSFQSYTHSQGEYKQVNFVSVFFVNKKERCFYIVTLLNEVSPLSL